MFMGKKFTSNLHGLPRDPWKRFFASSMVLADNGIKSDALGDEDEENGADCEALAYYLKKALKLVTSKLFYCYGEIRLIACSIIAIIMKL